MNLYVFAAIFGTGMASLSYWLYRCIVRIKEDQIKVVESFTGRYIQQFVGIEGKTYADEDYTHPSDPSLNITIGDLIDGEDDGHLAWIWFPFERIATYDMRKIVRVQTSDLTKEELDPENHLIAWGDPKNDTELSMYRSSNSNHYRRQFTYEMHFDNVETGRENKAEAAQNVKLRIRLNLTVCTKNAKDTMYREGDGGKWLTTLHSVTLSCLNELCANKTFTLISDLRGKKLDDQMLSDGKTFKQRINEQMLTVKNLGQETIDLDFLDYEIMKESQPFIKALQDRSVAAVNKETAGDLAEIKRLELQPVVNAKKDLIKASRDATMKLYGTENVTVVRQTQALPKYLRVFAGTLYSPTPIQFDTSLPGTAEIVKETIAHDIVHEITQGDQQQHNHNKKHHQNKKGGGK